MAWEGPQSTISVTGKVSPVSLSIIVIQHNPMLFRVSMVVQVFA
jgi:hypothetical protein